MRGGLLEQAEDDAREPAEDDAMEEVRMQRIFSSRPRMMQGSRDEDAENRFRWREETHNAMLNILGTGRSVETLSIVVRILS